MARPPKWACIRIATRRFLTRRWSRFRSAFLPFPHRWGKAQRPDPLFPAEFRRRDRSRRRCPDCIHGVDRIFPGTSTLLPEGGRINLTLRRVTRFEAISRPRRAAPEAHMKHGSTLDSIGAVLAAALACLVFCLVLALILPSRRGPPTRFFPWVPGSALSHQPAWC